MFQPAIQPSPSLQWLKDSVLLSMEYKAREFSFSVTISRTVHAQRKRHKWVEVEFWAKVEQGR